MLDQDRRDGFKDSTLFLVGHHRFLFGGVRHFRENLDGPPFHIGGRYEHAVSHAGMQMHVVLERCA